MIISEFFSKLLDPSTINIVLSLLLAFQWYKGHAKEQSVKNNLLGIKIVLDSEKKNNRNKALREFLDATLATIGARPPFVEKGKKTLQTIEKKFAKKSNGKIKQSEVLSPEKSHY